MDSLDKFLTASPIVTLVLPLISIYFLFVWRRNPKYGTKGTGKKAPELPGAWPIIGHLPMLSAGGTPNLLHKTLGAMADKYGPVFTFRIGVQQAFVVSSSEIAKECYTTLDKVFGNRPKAIAGDIIGHDNANIAFAPYGPYWVELRKIIMSELLSNRRLELLKQVRYSEVDTCMNELYESWVKHNNKSSGPMVVELKKWFEDLTLNMMLRMIAGKRYSTGTSASDSTEKMRWYVAMDDFMRLLSVPVIGDAVPFLRWFDMQGYKKEMKNTITELDSLFKGLLEDHRRMRLSGEAKGEQDFIDVMMSALENAKMSYYDHDTIITATCESIISGGAHTTMLTLAWIISLLLNNKHALKKAQDELDQHVGRDRRVNESDIKNLVYLQAIIKESFRLYPGAPLLGMRMATQDCTLAGYHVPAGSRLIVNISKIQRDPSVWSNPSEFYPERFLTSQVDVKGQHYDLMPFSTGRRICPGAGFAIQVTSLVAANLLQGFDLATQMDRPMDMTETGGTNNSKATPLEVIITPRLRSQLYRMRNIS